jgi:hypothetical protein
VLSPAGQEYVACTGALHGVPRVLALAFPGKAADDHEPWNTACAPLRAGERVDEQAQPLDGGIASDCDEDDALR